MPDVLASIGATRLVPVVVIDDAQVAGPLAEALIAGGLPAAEITFRTEAAPEALRAMAAHSEMLVGAGTVLTAEQVERAVDAGAQYIVTPGFDAAVVRKARDLGVPIFPGVATATEIQMALNEGLDVLKFFPAEPLGGVTMLSALAGPFPAVRFIPTGGVSAASLPDYLKHKAVLAVGGSWMVAGRLLADRDFASVSRLAAEAVDIVRSTAE
jgi:2-dehydro-3-deoxyphosphogluconate aldolase/(4S)-4-hydroxy-2-oxoglutarate aldolase